MGTVLTVNHIDKSFGAKRVLQGVDFFVEEGRIVGLVGPNGAGKSTIMKAILGLIPLNGGNIDIFGQPVSITSHQALGQVGALIEYPGIYPYLTGWQHLQLFAEKTTSKEQINSVVESLGMRSYITMKARRYSLGMKQKLGIALALINKPRLVILDEPMNGLDPQAVKTLRDLIKKMASEGVSFLVSSHMLDELEKLADDILFLNQGSIVRKGTMAGFLAQEGVMYRISVGNLEQAQAALAADSVAYDAVDSDIQLRDTGDGAVLNAALYALVNAGVAITSVVRNERDLETAFLDEIQGRREGVQ